MRPTKSVPGGCVLGLFGLGALAAGILALIAAWLVWCKHPGSHNLHYLLFTGVACLLVGIALLLLSYRLAIRIPRSYDPFDPDEPRMKF